MASNEGDSHKDKSHDALHNNHQQQPDTDRSHDEDEDHNAYHSQDRQHYSDAEHSHDKDEDHNAYHSQDHQHHLNAEHSHDKDEDHNAHQHHHHDIDELGLYEDEEERDESQRDEEERDESQRDEEERDESQRDEVGRVDNDHDSPEVTDSSLQTEIEDSMDTSHFVEERSPCANAIDITASVTDAYWCMDDAIDSASIKPKLIDQLVDNIDAIIDLLYAAMPLLPKLVGSSESIASIFDEIEDECMYKANVLVERCYQEAFTGDGITHFTDGLRQVINKLDMSDALQLLERLTECARADRRVAELSKLRRPKHRLTRVMVVSNRTPSEVFQQASAFLIDCLVVNRILLDDLRQRGILDNFMVNDIMSRRNRPHRVIHLIRVLSRLGEQIVTEFIKSLRTVGQQNIAETVEMRRETFNVRTVREVDEPATVAEASSPESHHQASGRKIT